MKSLRILASLMLALLLAFSTAPATALISADSQHDPKKEKSKDDSKSKEDKDDSKKEKDSKDDKDDSKKEKDSKKDKVDKAIDDVDKALDSDKEKGSKKDNNESKKEKDSEKNKNDSGKEKDAKNDKPSGDSDYKGTYRGYSSTSSGQSNRYEIALKLEKAKKGPLYTVEGALEKLGRGIIEPEIYKIQGAFSPKTGKLRATYKALSKNALGKGNVNGEYEHGSFTITVDQMLIIEEVRKE